MGPSQASHGSSETGLGGRSPETVPAPLLIFAELDLYGKTKKSTHDRTPHRPSYPVPTLDPTDAAYPEVLPYTPTLYLPYRTRSVALGFESVSNRPSHTAPTLDCYPRPYESRA